MNKYKIQTYNKMNKILDFKDMVSINYQKLITAGTAQLVLEVIYISMKSAITMQKAHQI